MSITDLIFILSVLGTLAALLRAAYLVLRGRRHAALRVALAWTIFALCYLSCLVIVSLAQPQRVLAVGTEQCFDDWCLTVDSAATAEQIGDVRANGIWLVVSTRVSSRMRRGRQAEPDAYGYLLDSAGSHIEQSERGQSALARAGLAGQPLGAALGPGESFTSRMVFDIPLQAGPLGFVKARRSTFPSNVIIGDPSSLFHKRTIVSLPH